MLNNYFTLKAVAKYLNENIPGYYISEIYTQEKNKLLIELSNDETKAVKVLEFSIEKDYNCLILKNNFSKAKKNYADLFEEIYGKKILSVSLYNDDRAVILKLKDEIEMIFTFFSNKANCFIAKGSIIVNSFKNKEDYLQKNVSEVIPLKQKPEALNIDNLTIRKYISQNFRTFGKSYCDEVLQRLLISDDSIMDNSKKEILDEEFNALRVKLESPEFILYSSDEKYIMSLVKLNSIGKSDVKEFENINDLIIEYLKLNQRKENIHSLKESKTDELNKKISNYAKKINSLKVQLTHSEESVNFKLFGNAILENLSMINKGDKIFKYNSNDGKSFDIKLKDSLSAVENSQNYFDKYKKQKSSADILNVKISKLEREKKILEDELEKVKDMNDYKQLKKAEKKLADSKTDETSKFRKFKLKGEYEVWVGKDSVSNDLLTTKYSAPNDLWFHVRGSSGSHTVLKVSNKKETVQKETIVRAASIAAYYSKARNASSVPVAYCEKKFVKKKKGFKSGSVVMEREKVIFAKPELPPENYN